MTALPPSVYKQPIGSIPGWAARGIRVFWSWEESLDPNGKPTVNLVDYLDTALANGCKVVVQLDAVQPIPWGHPAICGFDQPDEPDDKEVDLLANPQALEAYFVQLAANYNAAKQHRPDLPVFLNCDGWQFFFGKIDYPRNFACADGITFDYYPSTRNITFNDWVDRYAMVEAVAGAKLCGAFVGTSFQNLGAQFYPAEYAPTPDLVKNQIDFLKAKDVAWSVFCQSFNPFAYDSTPPAIVAVIQQEAGAATPAPVPSPGVPVAGTGKTTAQRLTEAKAYAAALLSLNAQLTAANAALQQQAAAAAPTAADQQAAAEWDAFVAANPVPAAK